MAPPRKNALSSKRHFTIASMTGTIVALVTKLDQQRDIFPSWKQSKIEIFANRHQIRQKFVTWDDKNENQRSQTGKRNNYRQGDRNISFRIVPQPQFQFSGVFQYLA